MEVLLPNPHTNTHEISSIGEGGIESGVRKQRPHTHPYWAGAQAQEDSPCDVLMLQGLRSHWCVPEGTPEERLLEEHQDEDGEEEEEEEAEIEADPRSICNRSSRQHHTLRVSRSLQLIRYANVSHEMVQR